MILKVLFIFSDLVLVWTNLHGRLKTSPQVFLAECRQLMKSATNVKSIFPFIRAVLQTVRRERRGFVLPKGQLKVWRCLPAPQVGEAGVQFCIELCANALQARLPCDVTTKSLIYKTVAALLPNDLEVCRACALLVFFQERTVESYKMVYLLYMLPDQEYHAEDSPIGNHVRFETLQVWNPPLTKMNKNEAKSLIWNHIPHKFFWELFAKKQYWFSVWTSSVLNKRGKTPAPS